MPLTLRPARKNRPMRGAPLPPGEPRQVGSKSERPVVTARWKTRQAIPRAARSPAGPSRNS